MNTEPIWRMVQNAARELTREGTVPFTRKEMIDKIHEHSPRIDNNSINPIIQGLTDNLRGGAPGADGKRVLHSVGRGQFVLHSKANLMPESHQNASDKESLSRDTKFLVNEGTFPKTEGELQDQILARLRKTLNQHSEIELLAEGRLPYIIDDDHTLYHSSDILAVGPDDNYVSIELKYKSAVTDQFKCRAYDALHLKKQYGNKILCIMMYVKTTSGISLNQARRISYPFDQFIGLPVSALDDHKNVDELAKTIINFLATND